MKYKDERQKHYAKEFLEGYNNYLRSGESLELVDGENMRIHDEELTVLMGNYIKQL